ncbi:MAG: hypothetical protein AAF847_14890, partial [Bacteroidota bacterium]
MLQKLEQAGFEYAPADRLRALRLLDRFAVEHLGNGEALKYRLAPILARNKNEQERFYKIYRQWWTAIQTEPLPEPPLKTAKSLPKWLLYFVAALVLTPLLVILVKELIAPEPPPAERPTLLMEGTPAIDSTIRFGLSEEADSTWQFNWELRDEQGQVEARLENEAIYTLTIDTLIGSPNKSIVLYLDGT